MSDAHVVLIMKAYAAAGTIKDNYANILVLLLRLRQACDHPLLLKGQESYLIDNSSIEMAKQLPMDAVTYLLAKLESGPVICSICSVSNQITHICTCTFCYLGIDSLSRMQIEIVKVKTLYNDPSVCY
jgi:SNF2 family DNA or RNA helicase